MKTKHFAWLVRALLVAAVAGFSACARERSSTVTVEVPRSSEQGSSVDRAIEAERAGQVEPFRVMPEGISVELQSVVLSVSDVTLSSEPKDAWISATVVIRNEGKRAVAVVAQGAVTDSILRSTVLTADGDPLQNATWVVTRSLGHARFQSDVVTIEPGANWSGTVQARVAVDLTALLGDATAGLCETERGGGKQRCPIRIERANGDAVRSSF